MIAEIYTATEHDIEFVSTHLREADRLELSLSRPDVSPVQTVMESVLMSRWCCSARIDEVPSLLFGVCDSAVKGVGIPWMVSTDGISRIKRPFVKRCTIVVDRMRNDFRTLYNRVHRENAIAIRWLEWLGFEVERTDDEFLNFWMGKENV
ncbi:hypothetical protein J5J83_19805 [Azoarcus sp. L1K30]|uniref:hypothetical protein n=1 Tax=Azoarcus sp. L1K30 TaxID=2820277 RepID=UPI001B83B116|nr:hypothetical protein [Azoarcus sp. L1K30]MBR0568373.1 hypothetical protein [Azoarcus sp. L1K30]